MAFSTNEIEIRIRAEDDSGTESSTSIFVSPDVVAHQDYAALVAYAAAQAAAVKAVSGARVADYSVVIRGFDSAAATADSDSNVERKLVLIGENARGKTVRYEIPSVLDAKVDENDDVDLLDTEVAALITNMTTGDGTVAPCDANLNAITAITKAYQYHQKSHLTKRIRKG